MGIFLFTYCCSPDRFRSWGQSSRSTRSAFTLVEVVAVIVVLGMIASATVYSMRPHLQKVQMEASIEKIAAFDRKVRQLASRSGQPIEFNVASGSTPLSIRSRGVSLKPVELANGIRVEQIRVGSDVRKSGALTSVADSNGQTPIYALQLQAGEDQRVWCVVLGMTGQVKTFAEGDVDALFRQ